MRQGLRRYLNFMMLSCKKATELMEKREVSPLSFVEGIQLKMHLSMCDACQSYEKQSDLINKAVGKWFSDKAEEKETLSAKAKENIRNKISHK